MLAGLPGHSEDCMFRDLLMCSFPLSKHGEDDFPTYPHVDDLPGFPSDAVSYWEFSPCDKFVLRPSTGDSSCALALQFPVPFTPF